MIQTQRYRRMDLSVEEQLRALFGTKGFEKYFQSSASVSLDVAKLTDQQTEAIVRALGDNACELLTAEFVIEPTEQYHRDRVRDDDVSAKVQKVEAEGLAIPFSPALKLAV